jgi:OOP family OmpA-OmpF porin
MFGFLKPLALISLTAPGLTLLGGTAMAQSSDQIISALKPTGNLVGGSTRGIKLGGSAPASAPTHSSAGRVAVGAPARHHVVNKAAQTPAPEGDPSINLTVNFSTGSADLTPAARASLDNLGKALSSSDLAKFRFRIEGHTDTVGSREENIALSRRRAEAVVAYLTTEFHVAASRLDPVGMGPDHPLVRTGPQTPEAKNRRVQVVNLGA